MGILEGAIIGAVVGVATMIVSTSAKNQRFSKLMKSITDPAVEYAALYHYASFKRYKKSFKFFDSYGVLYMIGKMAHYKTRENEMPVSFNLAECTVQAEPDWRMLKWFSINTPAGEKFYFNAHKIGAFKNNSDETLKGLAALKSKQGVA